MYPFLEGFKLKLQIGDMHQLANERKVIDKKQMDLIQGVFLVVIASLNKL